MKSGEHAQDVPEERRDVGLPDHPASGSGDGAGKQPEAVPPGTECASKREAGGGYLNAATIRFAIGVILLMAAAALAAVLLAQGLAEGMPPVGVLSFGILTCAGIVLATWGFTQVRAKKRALLDSAYVEGYARGYRAQHAPQPGDTCEACLGAEETPSENDARPVDQKHDPQSFVSAEDPVESLLAHTDDVFATLTSLVVNQGSDPQYEGLRQLLLGIGLPEWGGAEKVPCRLLGRNGCYWIAAQTDALPVDDYDRIMATEGALNLAKGVRLDHPQLDPADYREQARRLLSRPIPVRPGLSDVIRFLEAGYPDPTAALSQSEWAQRLAIADAAEDAVLPFRLVFDMRANATAGIVLIRLEIPRPACFASVASDDAARRQLAIVYAQRLAIFMAKVAFRVPVTRQAVVSCHEHDSLRTVLSLRANAGDAARLVRTAQQEPGWFNDPAFRVAFTEDGWFGAVEPHLQETADILEPDRYLLPTELDGRACRLELAHISHARTAADFGINEGAERQWIWRQFVDNMPTSTQEAVSRLLALKDKATDAHTMDACDRVVRTLAEGEGALPALEELRDRFFNGTELDQAVVQARQALTSNDLSAVEKAVDGLESALSTSMQISYLDDADTVFRYFNSVAERIAYNRRHASDRRQVRLVPDAYFNAIELTARLLTMIQRNDEALRYADEAARIAPDSINAALIRARVLESKSDVFGAVDCVKAIMRQATSQHDLSICLYRLAYFEWKLGQLKLSVACYRAAISLQTALSSQAALELAQFLAIEEGVVDLTDAEAKALLNEADIPYQLDPLLSQWMRACAIRCTDQHFYPVAASLTGLLVELLRDDALVDVYHSLAP